MVEDVRALSDEIPLAETSLPTMLGIDPLCFANFATRRDTLLITAGSLQGNWQMKMIPEQLGCRREDLGLAEISGLISVLLL